jgi:hypothetical protein
MVDLGTESVPAAFKKRWDELIAQNKTLKASTFEAQAEIKAAKEAKNPELEAARLRISELESSISKAEHASILGADSMSEEDTEFYDYVQYQYSKVTAEEGQEKPTFGDWYSGAKESNRVIAAAIKEKKGSAETTTIKASTKEKPVVVVAPKVAPKTVPARTSNDGSENVFDATTIGSMDPATFKKNQEMIRKSLLGS